MHFLSNRGLYIDEGIISPGINMDEQIINYLSITLTGSDFRVNDEKTRIQRKTGYGVETKDVADFSPNKNTLYLYKCLKVEEVLIIRNALGKYRDQVEVVENF
jgi:hypothetical protein